MRWRGPKGGERRIVKHFAIFPKRLFNGDYIWWESYYSLECYCWYVNHRNEITVNGKNNKNYWQVVRRFKSKEEAF